MQEYEYFHNSQEGQLKFGEWLGEFDWSSVLACPTPSMKVEKLHVILEKGMKRSFSLIKKKKTSEPAWMSEKNSETYSKEKKSF